MLKENKGIRKRCGSWSNNSIEWQNWQNLLIYWILFDTGEHNNIGNRIDLPMPIKKITGKEIKTKQGLSAIYSNTSMIKVEEIQEFLEGDCVNAGHSGTTTHDDDAIETSEELSDQGDDNEKTGQDLLTLPNGVQLTFGHILALAGDYYAVPGSQIVNPKTVSHVGSDPDPDRQKRFIAAFDSLAKDPRDKVKKRIEKLVAMIEEEESTSGKGQHSDKEWDEATGGFWVGGLPINPGTMLKLAESNYDHFQPQAKHAYLVGHELALGKAREAGREQDVEKQKMMLMEAYSMDAFAGHFLTDAFSSGHIRTPRVELGKSTTPSQVGHLLSKYMHDEDNVYGLRVTNVRGDKWICYGDGKLMKKESEKNFKLVVETVQTSVRQIFEAFNNPDGEINPDMVTDLLPFVDSEEGNNSPLFQMKNGKLHRRSDVSDLQHTKTTSNWWGITTATALQVYKKKNPVIPPI